MKKGFAIILIVFLSCGALFATDDTSNNNVEVALDISGSSVTDIGFASKAVEYWATDPTPIPASSISLTPNMEDGSFSYAGSDDSGLFAYARIQSGNAVDIRLKSTQLKGYANNVEVTGAELNWIVKPVADSGSYNTTNFTAEGTTFDDTTTTTGNIFTHEAATTIADKNAIYCVELNIASPTNQDFRDVAMEHDVENWKATLTIEVVSDPQP